MKYIDELVQNHNLYDLDWMTGQYFFKLSQFKSAYNIEIPVIIIAAFGIEFMNERLECSSCEVTGDYYEEFYQFIVNYEQNIVQKFYI